MANFDFKFWGAQIVVWLLSLLLLGKIFFAYADPIYLQRDYLFIFTNGLTVIQKLFFIVFYVASMCALPYVTKMITDQNENKYFRYFLICSYPVIYMFLTFVAMVATGINLEMILNVSLVDFAKMFFVFWSVCILIYKIEAEYLLEKKLKNLKKLEDKFEKIWPFNKKGS